MVRTCYTLGLPLSVQRIRGYQLSFLQALESSESQQILFWSWSSASMHPLKGKWNQRLLHFFDNFSQAWHSRPFKLKIILIADKLCTYLYLFSWKNGLLFHQAVVDLSRSAILLPLGNKSTEIKLLPYTHTILGQSIYACQPVTKCSLVETTFLLLVTVSTVSVWECWGLMNCPIFSSNNKAIYCMTASFRVSHECESMSVQLL